MDSIAPRSPYVLLEKENAALRSALQNLYDAQNGPPLLRKKDKDAWEAAMAEAERLLKQRDSVPARQTVSAVSLARIVA